MSGLLPAVHGSHHFTLVTQSYREMMGKATKFMTSHPFVVFIILAFLVGVFGVIPIKIWTTATKNITNELDLVAEGLVSKIENVGKFIYPNTNSSTIGLARVIDSYLTNNPQFTEIEKQIAPVLFQAYSTIPQVSQVSYISTDGLLFSYITEINTSVAVFANSSNGGGEYSWYSQTVDQITGRLIGNAVKSQQLNVTNTDWYQAAQRNETTSFVGMSFGGEDNESLFQSVVTLYSKKGVVSLGFPLKPLTGFLNSSNLHGGEIYIWTQNDTLLVHEGSLSASFFISNGSICFGRESKSVRSQCVPRNCSSGGYEVEIEKLKYQAFCSVLEVSGVPLRYTLMLPNKGEGTSIKNAALYMLIVTMILGVCWPLGFVMFMVRAARKEMHMRGRLINQMEATQQAERKSMNKSDAFSIATHDIRGLLRGITGWIGLCYEEVRPGSEVENYLNQINACTQELLDLLNSVLDMSKIESGKMHLEEKEFNLAKLLEDVTDFFHPAAMQKGVDVVLDLHDNSICKYSNVIGDGGKLKQILNNLVGNAVKFTVEGHISIRVWAQRPGSKNFAILPSSSELKRRSPRFLKCMFGKNKDQSSSTHDVETATSIRNNANTMEFVFEVDDTGRGIPMEMRKLVFENYVQVKETAQGDQGTGLGLGIVQSLVRLMGGEIRITDKAMGEKGTCFQFNVLLTTLESSANDIQMKQDTESNISTPNLGLTINTSTGSSSMNIRNLSPRFNTCLTSSPRFNTCLTLSTKQENSHVVLLLKGEERRRVTEKYIKGLNSYIKVKVVEKWEHLSHDLERLFRYSPQSSMRNEVSSPRSRELPLLGNDGVDSRSQVPKRRNNSYCAVVLLVIDAKAGPSQKLNNIVKQFRKGLYHGISCQVVWLNGPTAEKGDISYLKPLHGSRLNRVLKMLPEFGGTMAKEAPLELQRYTNSEIQEEEPSSTNNKKSGKTIMGPPSSEKETPGKSVRAKKPIEDEQGTSKQCDDGLLRGKKVLLVDDTLLQCKFATTKLKKMGVSEVTQCNSGIEAVRLVSELLTQGSITALPFDYIFMDCQMPGMNGYEATREIRKVEKKYGVHTPILALSAHDHGSPEAQEAIKAGMDAFLGKSLNEDLLMNIIKELESKMSTL